jgi:glycosyltransferase involved in cell wall biosynthesis
MQKKRIGVITSSPILRTGFSNNARAILPLLYNSGKYDIYLLSQGSDDREVSLQKMPWKTRGAIRPGEFNEDLFNRDGNYQRLVAYGNFAVQNWIIENKLDCIIHIEDIWSAAEEYYLKSKWWPFLKNNFLQWSTADSLPILNSYKTWAENCPNIWLWATFGVNSLRKENKDKYGHVKCVHGVLDLSEYEPTSFAKKMELRDKFGIDRDTIIFFKLGRSQLRKLYPSVLEAYSSFKKQYPQYKTKLHFHCSFSEGWPYENLIQYYGIDKNDILVTYFCRSCSEYEIKPFLGEDQDCRFCGNKKSQITAGVTSTISNKELSSIYGISDAAISCFTSGGLEFHNVQSLLCGLPLLSSDYSSGEDFVKNDFVFRLDGTYTHEAGTGFIKHVPNINTMVKFMRKICEMTPRERQEIGKQGRAWALKTFDPQNAVKELENFIDNCPPVAWDYVLPPDNLKNPNAEISNIENNKEWVKSLYKNILNMEMPEDDTGLSYWVTSLANGMQRQQVDQYFRKVAVEENEKIKQQSQNQNTVTLESLFPRIEGKKNVILTLKESLGDHIILTGLLPAVYEKYPLESHTIYLCCDPKFFEVHEGNTNIKLVPYNSIMDSELYMIGSGQEKGVADYYHNIGSSTQKFLNYLGGKY